MMPKVVVTIDFNYFKKLDILIAVEFFFKKTMYANRSNILYNLYCIKYWIIELEGHNFEGSISANLNFNGKDYSSDCVSAYLTLHLRESSVPSTEPVTQHP